MVGTAQMKNMLQWLSLLRNALFNCINVVEGLKVFYRPIIMYAMYEKG